MKMNSDKNEDFLLYEWFIDCLYDQNNANKNLNESVTVNDVDNNIKKMLHGPNVENISAIDHKSMVNEITKLIGDEPLLLDKTVSLAESISMAMNILGLTEDKKSTVEDLIKEKRNQKQIDDYSSGRF